VTSTIVFEDDGRLQEYVGGYDDWLRQRNASVIPSKPIAPKEKKQKREKAPQEKKKLSFKEARELESLPPVIEALEEEKRLLMETLNSPDFYADRDMARISAANDRREALERELDSAYHRWDELEKLQASFGGTKE